VRGKIAAPGKGAKVSLEKMGMAFLISQILSPDNLKGKIQGNEKRRWAVGENAVRSPRKEKIPRVNQQKNPYLKKKKEK